LLNGVEWPAHRQTLPNDTVSCKQLVAPPAAVPEELSGKPESSSFSILVKAEGAPVAWMIRQGHEWEDFNRRVREDLKFENFSASVNSRVWTEDFQPLVKDQTVTVTPRLRAGAPKRAKPDVWPDSAVPLSHIANPAHEWTIHAKLSPNQIGTNDRVLDVLEEVCKLEQGPYYVGHIWPPNLFRTRISKRYEEC
jgi:hypothetical protein